MEWIPNILAYLKEFSPVIISVASFSFQIAGAIILLLWSFGPFEKTVMKNYFEQPSSPTFGRIGDGKLWTKITKEEQQITAKTVCLNRFAFIDIILGYVFSIFMKETSVASGYIFLSVIFLTILILLIEKISIRTYVRKKYTEDQEIEDFT